MYHQKKQMNKIQFDSLDNISLWRFIHSFAFERKPPEASHSVSVIGLKVNMMLAMVDSSIRLCSLIMFI